MRIIEAAIRCVDRNGPTRTTLSDVAADLGVTRQTVYRYFPGTDRLFSAVARVANEAFLDELTHHLEDITGPTDWVVEAVATAIELLPRKPHLTLVLAAGRSDSFAHDVTSSLSVALSRTLFERSPIDWVAAGYHDGELDELVGFLLRIIQSMVIDPPDPPKTGGELRRYLSRWVGPAVTTTRPVVLQRG